MSSRESKAAGYLVLGVLVALWAWRAFSDSATYDGGLAYVGGQVGWATGHPEHWFSWTGTPFLAVAMAITTQLMSAASMGVILTIVNVILVVGTVAYVLRELRSQLSPVWWWVTAVGLLTFAPMMSSVWWKQFNIISLVLTLAGFELLRRHRDHAAGGMIGLALAVKPLAILLPPILLLRRRTRRAGVIAIGYLIGLNLAAQGLLAAHAHASSALNPLLGLQNFSDKSKPAFGLACSPENFAPQSLLCRIVGVHHIQVQRVFVWFLVALLAAWVLYELRDRSATSWDVFAFSCAISTMASPIAWSHYQVMLAPLFVLLVVRFTHGEANGVLWIGLAAALVLCELMWSPYGTLTDAVRLSLSSTFRANPHPTVTDIAQFAQYLLILTGVLWYVRERRRNPRLQPA